MSALRIQIWTALIALLLKWLHHLSKATWSLSNLASMLRMNVFTYRLEDPMETPPLLPTPEQLTLMRIPVMWGTHSVGSGPASESRTQGKAMMREVDHFSQEEFTRVAESAKHHFVSVIVVSSSTESDRYIPVK